MPVVGDPTRAPGVVFAGFDGVGNEIRRFNDSAIQAQIDRAVDTLKPGDRGAIVAVIEKKAGEDGQVRLAGVVKPFGSDKFSVVGFLSHDLGKPIGAWDAQAAIKVRF